MNKVLPKREGKEIIQIEHNNHRLNITPEKPSANIGHPRKKKMERL